MAWKAVGNKTETVTAQQHITQPTIERFYRGVGLLTILGHSRMLCYFQLVSAV